MKEALPSQIVSDARPEVENYIPPADLAMAYHISNVLERHYPGHPWLINVSHEQGGAWIKNPALMINDVESADNYAMFMRLNDLKSDPTLKTVVRMAGEMLERWEIARGAFKPENYEGARPRFNDKKLLRKHRLQDGQ